MARGVRDCRDAARTQQTVAHVQYIPLRPSGGATRAQGGVTPTLLGEWPAHPLLSRPAKPPGARGGCAAGSATPRKRRGPPTPGQGGSGPRRPPATRRSRQLRGQRGPQPLWPGAPSAARPLRRRATGPTAGAAAPTGSAARRLPAQRLLCASLAPPAASTARGAPRPRLLRGGRGRATVACLRVCWIFAWMIAMSAGWFWITIGALALRPEIRPGLGAGNQATCHLRVMSHPAASSHHIAEPPGCLTRLAGTRRFARPQCTRSPAVALAALLVWEPTVLHKHTQF